MLYEVLCYSRLSFLSLRFIIVVVIFTVLTKISVMDAFKELTAHVTFYRLKESSGIIHSKLIIAFCVIIVNSHISVYLIVVIVIFDICLVIERLPIERAVKYLVGAPSAPLLAQPI